MNMHPRAAGSERGIHSASRSMLSRRLRAHLGGSAGRNAGFIRQKSAVLRRRQDESGVPAGVSSCARWLFAASLLALLPGVLLAEDAPKKSETAKAAAIEESSPEEYNNWLTLGVGHFFVDGDKAQFMRRQQVPAGTFGGVEDFHFEQPVAKKGLFQVDGRGIFDNHDYALKLGLSHPDKGYIRAGYREFRTWYDGSGGFSSLSNVWLSLYNEELHIDRGNAWFEAGLTLPNLPVFTIRYDYLFRNGKKDSTIWGDYNLNIGTANPTLLRGIVPSFLQIDEKRHIGQADMKHTIGQTDFGVGFRYDHSDNDNSRNIHRRPGELPPVSTPGFDRFVTQKDHLDSDMYNVHAFTETRLNERALFTVGYSFTSLDTDIGGSRIYGSDYDPVYDPLFSRGHFHDEGFLNLSGGSHLNQHVGNLNFMLTPWENVTLVPSLRVERQDQDGTANYIGTDFPVTGMAEETPVQNQRQRGFTDVSEALELRYTGITNWALYARGDWLEGEGNLKERETEAQTGVVNRDTDSTRFTQKYTLGANWYPQRRLNLGGQYYYKSRQNNYDHLVDSTPNAPPSGDRYPAYLLDQDFQTHDMNFRVTWRPLAAITTITRYDFQLSTIDTHPDFLAEIQSAKSTAHILSESISWVPSSRLFLQGSINYVWDQTDTPAAQATPGTNLVLNGKNNYWNASAMANVVLSEKTDFQPQYLYYRARNYEDNSAFSQPYGAGAEEHFVTAALIHRFTRRLQWTLRYGFFINHDQTSGGHNNYTAHMVYSSVRYAF